jgi:catechol 2,3-dioxygenase-like lactoylglutathione lyase family enzyme
MTLAMKLELVPIPVADVDRAKAFYTGKLGFVVDVDVSPGEGVRIVQLTPPGSACSILLATGLPAISDVAPGSVKGLHIVVRDIYQARETLAGRGVELGQIDVHDRGVKYVSFSDPDGNLWLLQEMPWRSPDFE